MQLNLAFCTLLAGAAEAKAAAMDVPMVIALVDARGELLYFARMAGALPASTEIAVAKAYTAAALRMPTEQAGALVQPGQSLYGIAAGLSRPVITFGGGRPIRFKKETIGAMGVSGGTVPQDMSVVDAGLACCEKIEAFYDLTAALVPAGIRWTAAAGPALQRMLGELLPAVDAEQIRALAAGILLA